MNFNTLAVKETEQFKILLAPFCEIYQNKEVSSDYNLWFNRPAVVAKNSHGLFPYLPDADIKEILQDKTRIIWAIVISTKDHPFIYLHIGNVSLQRIDLHNLSAEIAIVIGEPAYYGKGIATFAVDKICEHGFMKLGLNRIWSGTAATNIGMQKVFEKLGFEEEGIFKEAMYLDGEYINVYEYGLLRGDWEIRISPEEELGQYVLDEGGRFNGCMPDEELYDTINQKIEIEALIDQIEQIRSRNNKHWMQLVRMAFRHDRESAKAIMWDIVKCDKEIQEASAKLAEE